LRGHFMPTGLARLVGRHSTSRSSNHLPVKRVCQARCAFAPDRLHSARPTILVGLARCIGVRVGPRDFGLLCHDGSTHACKSWLFGHLCAPTAPARFECRSPATAIR
jgi:hypothetical protein